MQRSRGPGPLGELMHPTGVSAQNTELVAPNWQLQASPNNQAKKCSAERPDWLSDVCRQIKGFGNMYEK